jgi:hypothetical protein
LGNFGGSCNGRCWYFLRRFDPFNGLFKNLFLSSTHNDNAYSVMTTALQCINSLKPFTLAGFEPGIFCSLGGCDDYYTTPPGLTPRRQGLYHAAKAFLVYFMDICYIWVNLVYIFPLWNFCTKKTLATLTGINFLFLFRSASFWPYYAKAKINESHWSETCRSAVNADTN